jgi:hypothetical protein
MTQADPPATDQPEPPRLRVGRRVPAADFDGSERLACIDGRHDGPIVGAPGGDAGELVLLLSALEDEMGQAFSESEVLSILEAYIEAHGRFYLHTDRAALDQLEETLEAKDIGLWKQARQQGKAIESWLEQPPLGVRALLLRLLTDPKHVGCGHLKTLLQHPKQAGVRRDLVASVIRAFLQLLWRGDDRPEYVVLEGGHAEESIVIVEDFGDDGSDDVPEIEPAEGASDIFVVHMPIRRRVWRRDLRFIERSIAIPGFELDDLDDALAAMEKRAERQSETTIQALAPSLPIWKASVTGTSVEVTRA